ncbi:hypothetical protein H5410_002183 [Solanum commersonii]|uniref:Uncharacterized protein n=1 Tax=Solanum commersonii TaxID=4109 RepID=A0A9J6B1L2_SOLCO|nr:hypothetical protein H5410_002183 [Solanum commersonii]
MEIISTCEFTKCHPMFFYMYIQHLFFENIIYQLNLVPQYESLGKNNCVSTTNRLKQMARRKSDVAISKGSRQ